MDCRCKIRFRTIYFVTKDKLFEYFKSNHYTHSIHLFDENDNCNYACPVNYSKHDPQRAATLESKYLCAMIHCDIKQNLLTDCD